MTKRRRKTGNPGGRAGPRRRQLYCLLCGSFIEMFGEPVEQVVAVCGVCAKGSEP